MTRTDEPKPPWVQGFEEYASRRAVPLLRAAYVLTGQQAAAEDLVQETLARTMQVWRRISRDGGSDPDAYVYRTLVNTHRSLWRRFGSRELPTARLPEHRVPDATDRSDSLDELARALARLTARQRSAVVLRHYVQLSEQETAAVLGCQVGTVKSLTSRGLAQLRELLSVSTSESIRSSDSQLDAITPPGGTRRPARSRDAVAGPSRPLIHPENHHG